MKRIAIVFGLSLLVSMATLAGGQTAARADDECAEKGKCPLHDWMESNLQDPMDAGDLKKVAASLEKLAGMAPDPKWNAGADSWEKIAKDGAAAAKAGDAKATGQACKTCHKAFRKQYKAEHRSKPIKG